jgi:hypothetical protein
MDWFVSSMSHASQAGGTVRSLGDVSCLIDYPGPRRRSRVLCALWLATLAGPHAWAAADQVREFNLPAARVWAAAVDVARSSFSLETSSKKDGALRFRTGSKLAFRFEVSVKSISASKTCVVVRPRTTGISVIDRSVRRSGDKYLEQVAARLVGRP